MPQHDDSTYRACFSELRQLEAEEIDPEGKASGIENVPGSSGPFEIYRAGARGSLQSKQYRKRQIPFTQGTFMGYLPHSVWKVGDLTGSSEVLASTDVRETISSQAGRGRVCQVPGNKTKERVRDRVLQWTWADCYFIHRSWMTCW